MGSSVRRKRHLPSSEILSRCFQDAQKRAPGALEQLFAHYRPLLLYLADRRLRGPLRPKVGASDLVQMTEWNACQNFATQSFATRQGFHAWLLTILDNQVADVGRRFITAKKRDVSLERPLQNPETQDRLRQLSARLSAREAGSETADSIERVMAALDELPPHYQLVLSLRYFEMQSFQRIGEQFDRPADAARMLHNRALARLRALLTPTSTDQPT